MLKKSRSISCSLSLPVNESNVALRRIFRESQPGKGVYLPWNGQGESERRYQIEGELGELWGSL